MLGVAAFALVVAVMLAYYGNDRRQKKQLQRVEQIERERDGMQNYSRRRAAERTEAAERAMTEGPYGARPAPPAEPANKVFTKEQFDREQERRDEEMRRRVERERYEIERDQQRREYEARREEEAARRNAIIKE